MRRSDREVTDKKAVESFIYEQQILRIGFYDNDEVYIVPVNYGFSRENGEYIFYFHGAKAGRKYGLAAHNPVVGFEIDGEYELQKGDFACDYSAKFISVTGSGRLSIATNREEKLKGLNCLMRQLSGKDNWEYSEKMLDAAAVFILRVNKMSCKAKK